MSSRIDLHRYLFGVLCVTTKNAKGTVSPDLNRGGERGNMTYKFVIRGRMDNLNNYTSACRSNAWAGHTMKVKNQKLAEQAIKEQLKRIKITNPVRIHYSWYEKNKARDLDNVSGFGHKVIQDALVECGTLEGDGWRHITGFTDEFYCDKENPRIEVTIEEMVV